MKKELKQFKNWTKLFSSLKSQRKLSTCVHLSPTLPEKSKYIQSQLAVAQQDFQPGWQFSNVKLIFCQLAELQMKQTFIAKFQLCDKHPKFLKYLATYDKINSRFLQHLAIQRRIFQWRTFQRRTFQWRTFQNKCPPLKHPPL